MRSARLLSIALLGGCLLLPGTAFADLASGRQAYDAGDYATALREFKPLARAGDAEAQYWIGLMLSEGRGMPADPASAVRFLQRSADQGYADAQSYLGWSYETGTGVEKDVAEAIRLYRLAAAQGVLYAQVAAADLLLQDDSSPGNTAEAAEWLQKAADQGDAWATSRLAALYSEGAGVPRDLAEAERLYRIAVGLDSDDARNGLAWLLATNDRDLNEALGLAKQAVAAQPDDAAFLDTLALIEFKRGEVERAITHFTQAADNWPDYAPIHDRLGDAYAANGQNDLAIAQWQQALELSDPGESVEAGWDRAAVEAKLNALSGHSSTGDDAAGADLDARIETALIDVFRKPDMQEQGQFRADQAEPLARCVAHVLVILPTADKQAVLAADSFYDAMDDLSDRIRDEHPELNTQIEDGIDDCLTELGIDQDG